MDWGFKGIRNKDFRLTDDPRRKELLNAIFAIKGSTIAKCFWPGANCPHAAIRAHSVQNATALGLLEERGHVIAPSIRLDRQKGPIIDLRSVGRNRATTFAGLCAAHDQEAFAPIELGELDLDDPEHRFLLAFRATFYEVHATASAAMQVQSAYVKRVELGLDPKSVPSAAGIFATQRLFVAWQTYMYMTQLAQAYVTKRFDFAHHDLRLLDVEMPTLAASALFSLDARPRKNDVIRVCLTVLPTTRTQTALVLSYTRDDANSARRELKKLLTSESTTLTRELTLRLLNHCANFVLSPLYVASWTPTKRAVVIDLFKRTVFHNDLDFDHAELDLFASASA